MKGKRLRNSIHVPKVALYNIAAIALLLVLWEASVRIVNSPFFPSFTDVIRAFIRITFVGDIEGYTLLDHAVASMLRILTGFSFACLTGIPLGLLIGLRHETYDSLRAIIEPIRFIPPIAWIPLAYVLLSGYSRYILIIWLGAFFPILLNTIAGVNRTNPVLIDAAKTFGAHEKSIVSKVVIPSSLPETAAGMRIGLGVGWMCIVAAEMIGGETVGLGRLIIKYAELLQIDVSIMGMIAIGLIGLFMNEIFLKVEKRLFVWRTEIKM